MKNLREVENKKIKSDTKRHGKKCVFADGGVSEKACGTGTEEVREA